MFFEEFGALNPSLGQGFVSRVDAALVGENVESALVELRRFVLLAQRGLLYFHEYDRLPLGLVVGALLVAWMTLLLASLLGELCFEPADVRSGNARGERSRNALAFLCAQCTLLNACWLLFSIGVLLLASLYGFCQWTHYVYVLLALLTLLLALNELRALYTRVSSATEAGATRDSSASRLPFGGSAASAVGRLLLLVSMIQLMKRAFTSRSAMVFSHVLFTLWAVLELAMEPIRWRALGAPPRRAGRSHKARTHRHSSGAGAGDAEPDGEHVDDDEEEALMRREAAKLLVDVRSHTLVTAGSDEDARVQLRFFGAPNAISLDSGHLWCLLNSLLAVFPIAPTIGKFTSPTALYGV